MTTTPIGPDPTDPDDPAVTPDVDPDGTPVGPPEPEPPDTVPSAPFNPSAPH